MSNFAEKIQEELDVNVIKAIVKGAYEETYAKIESCEQEEKNKKVADIFLNSFAGLKDKNLTSKEYIKALLCGIKRAYTAKGESEILALIDEMDKIKKTIAHKKDKIKEDITQMYSQIEALGFDGLEYVRPVINESLIEEIELLGILKEVSESAFLSVVEEGDDVEENIKFNAKNIVYGAINEGEFKRQRFIDISRIVLSQAIIIANEGKLFAPHIIKGAVEGANEGIRRAISKFKDEIKFAPAEINFKLNLAKAELDGIDEGFRDLLKELQESCDEPTKSILAQILAQNYDSYTAKMRKISSQTQEQIARKIEDLGLDQNYKELSAKAKEIKNELSAKSAKFIEELEIDTKLEHFKKELEIDEKIANFKRELDAFEKKSIARFQEFIAKMRKDEK